MKKSKSVLKKNFLRLISSKKVNQLVAALTFSVVGVLGLFSTQALGQSCVTQTAAKLEIEPSLIKEIAKVHSRFAFAIASVKNSNYDYIKFYMTPKPITIEDVEERLSPDYEEKLLEKQIKSWKSDSVVSNETRKLEEIKPVIYEINIQGTKLVLNVVQGTTLDPAYKKLEIDFVQVDSKQGQTLKAVSWRIE